MWRSIAATAPPPPLQGRPGGADDVAFFALEELDGSYHVVDGQLVFGEAASELKGDSAAVAKQEDGAMNKAKKKEKKKEKQPKKANAGVACAAGEEPKVVDSRASKASSRKAVKSEKLKSSPASIPANNSNEEEEAAIQSSRWTSFGLHPNLCKALVTEMGFSEPTAIQALCIPAALVRGKDILGCAVTGSGKTLAYGLPILSALLSSPPKPNDGLACLILTPTRELAMQVVTHLRNVLVCEPLETRPRVEALVGGMAMVKQQRVLSRKPAVIVATVGRLMAIVKDGDEHVANLGSSLRFLVLDEADRMVDKAHYSDLLPVVDLLKGSSSKKRQVLLFSATLLSRDGEQSRAIDKIMSDLARRGKPEQCSLGDDDAVGEEEEEDGGESKGEGSDAEDLAEDDADKKGASGKTLAAKPESSTGPRLPATLRLAQILCTEEEKTMFLYYFCTQYSGSTLVFVNTIAQAKRVAGTLNLLLPKPDQGPVCLTLHANMEQKQRLKHLDRFKLGNRVLVATDVAARGLDVPNVDHVVQFCVPAQLDSFVHRSGRTARAGKDGIVVCLVSGKEMKQFSRIEAGLGLAIAALPVDQGILPKVRARVRLADKIREAESKQHEVSLDKQWFTKAAKEMDIILDDDDEEKAYGSRKKGSVKRALRRDDQEQEQERRKREQQSLRNELDARLKEDLWPKGKSRLYVAGVAAPELMAAARSGGKKRTTAIDDLKSGADGKKRKTAIA